MPVHWTVVAAVFVLGLTLASCGGDSEDDPAETVATATEAATSPAANPTQAAPTDSAGSELEGDWKTTISPGDDVILTLRSTGHAIRRGPASGGGAVRFGAEQIEFYGSNLCDGTGTYRWSLVADVLTFEEVGEDPCGGRSEVLVGQEYARD